jgi:hypothetical protein
VISKLAYYHPLLTSYTTPKPDPPGKKSACTQSSIPELSTKGDDKAMNYPINYLSSYNQTIELTSYSAKGAYFLSSCSFKYLSCINNLSVLPKPLIGAK